jgi:23S rRNA (guanine2445-N2)-methyltransferase / 23S rRNA (guanine2069-N7)-methyltransferase
MDFFATAPKGLEGLLADEIRALGAADAHERRAGCAFTGDLALAYRVCLWSRVASRVLLPLVRFPAADPDQLYEGVRSVPWGEHLDPEDTLAVDVAIRGSSTVHTHYAALRTKDAVVDQFRERLGVRPSVDVHRPSVRLNVLFDREEATLSVDLSGESLHRRAYRREGEQVEAPMKENLAAAVLLRSGWPDIAAAGGALLDPMCGSGTLLIEGALIAGDVAPGLLRGYFGFLGWKQHDRAAWKAEHDHAARRRAAARPGLRPVTGYDVDPRALRLATESAGRAGLGEVVNLERRDVAALVPPRFGDELPSSCPGLVVANPPYGTRLGEAVALRGLYRTLGSRLNEGFPGWRLGLLTGDPELSWATGLRARRTYSLYSGALPVKLYTFALGDAGSLPARPNDAPVDVGSVPSLSDTPTVDVPSVAGSVPRSESHAGMFADRLRKNTRHLAKWARREGVTCYRIYDADLPEYNLAVDLYERWVQVQEYEAPATIDAGKARERLNAALAVIPDVLGVSPDDVFLKVRRRQRGAAQYERQGSTGRFYEIGEAGCRFLVNFTDYLDTGLFLDQRSTRDIIAELARGRRFLNLFGYTGTATVRAARAGASATTTVDLSPTYLAWARRNLELNRIAVDGISGSGSDTERGQHRLIQADAVRWLGSDRDVYDVVFLDPPTFSNSRRGGGLLFDVQRDHVPLIRDAVRRLAPGGVLIFSANARRFRLDEAELPGLCIEDITRRTIPPDFIRNPRVHNCWTIRHAEDPRGG